MMRGLIAVLCVGLGASTAETCSIVEIAPHASPKGHIQLLLNGKAQKGLKVDMEADGRPAGIAVTDARGRIWLKALIVGTYYCFTANQSPDLAARLCLQVSADKGAKREFTMALEPPTPSSFLGKLKAAQHGRIEKQIQALNVVVMDPAGAPIRRARVAVYRHGAGAESQPLTTFNANGEGHVVASLAPGDYVLTIQSSGFESAFTVVEIVPSVPAEGFEVRLNIGSCSSV